MALEPGTRTKQGGKGVFSKKQESPPRAQYEVCHATWWGDTETCEDFTDFNSNQNGKESSRPWTSGTPPPCLFSILINSVDGGAFALIDFQKFASGPWLTGGDVLDRAGLQLEGLRILGLQGRKARGDLVARQLVQRVDGLAAVDGQPTHRRPKLFGVDGGAELTRLFGTLRKLRQPLELADGSHTIAALALLTQLGDALDDMGVVLPVQQSCGVGSGGLRSIAGTTRALGVRQDPLDDQLTKGFLPGGQLALAGIGAAIDPHMHPIRVFLGPDKLTRRILAGFILFQRQLGAFAFRHPVLQDGCGEHTTKRAALSSEFPYRVFWGALPNSQNRKNYAGLILQLIP